MKTDIMWKDIISEFPWAIPVLFSLCLCLETTVSFCGKLHCTYVAFEKG